MPTIVGLIGISIVVVLGSLACLLYVFRLSAGQEIPSTPIVPSPTFDLPTPASAPDAPGPPLPEIVTFAAEEPIQGFSDCNRFGFHGVVTGRNGQGKPGVQIVVWEDRAELLAIGSTDEVGNYAIVIDEQPSARKLWVQVFENDLPVSSSLFLETQIDCQTGYQIFQIDWRQVAQ